MSHTIGEKENGFTLFELIVVMFIISLVLGISLPSFTSIGESRIKSDAKKLASIIRYINDTSVSTKDNLKVEIDFKGKAIRYKTAEGDRASHFDSLSGVELMSKGLITEGDVVILFGPAGAQESFRIYLDDTKTRWVVTMNPMSGRVTIENDGKQKV